ncbi:selenocysteine-specific translation elongation factor [Helicobacter bizzozeronii]|nr:selenocysteine-specific translation elongation factor [Helicobacter bizzozeronii]
MPEYFLLGVCGHVDHGKSALIKALTGFEGDTSVHEKERGITIDLSFSALKSAARTLGFVDVPGHQDLVFKMVGGSFGLDVGLLVVDAHEGLKAQSLEHACILSFLKIPCVVVLSKADKCLDLEVQKQNIQASLKPYQLTILALLTCSIYDSQSLEDLKSFLLSYPFCKRKQGNDLDHLFRLYIDRVFVLPGRGVAVSGSVLGGSIKEHDKVWIAPLNRVVGVKSLHQHAQEIQEAHQHERVALQLQGVKAGELKIGMLLSTKGYLRGFDCIDVKLLKAPQALEIQHNQRISLQIGMLKIQAKVLILQYPYATLVLDQAIFACFGDVGIVSLQQRIWGAAVILNPITDLLKKPIKLDLLKVLDRQDWIQAFSILAQAHKKGFGLLSSLQRFALKPPKALEIAHQVSGVVVDCQEYVLYPQSTLKSVTHTIANIYQNNPQALLSAKSLAHKHSYISPHLAALAFQTLQDQGKIEEQKGLWVQKGLILEKVQEKLQDKLYALLKQGQFAPQAPYNLYDALDVDRQVGDRALKALCQAKKVVRLSHNVFVESQALQQVLDLILKLLQEHPSLDIQLLKTYLPLSRKFLIAYLEYLDSLGKTTNLEGKRFLKKGFKNNS